jgi:outer membrane protein assembly factor BamA
VRRFLNILFIFITGSIILSCSNTKFLAEDEKLYTYTWFSEEGLEKVKLMPLKAYELYSVGVVKTNRPVILLPRMNLTIYNYFKPSGTWGPRYYIHRVWGKPPVLLSDVNPEFRAKVMQQKLAEMGHFDSEVNLDLRFYGNDDKKARAKYNVLFKKAYIYNNLNFFPKQSPLDSIIDYSMAESIIEKGNDYWIEELEDERGRLSSIIRNQGYYYFNPDYLFFQADTTVGQKQVDLRLILKDELPPRAYNRYQVSKVNMFVKSNREGVVRFIPVDSAFRNNIQFYQAEKYYRPKVITRHIALKPGSTYSYRDHENTLRYLQGMGAFRSVSISFVESDSVAHHLDANIELVPIKPVQTNLEVNFATKSDDFIGPAAVGSLGFLNVLKGAEQLTIQIDGGFEWQKRSKRKEYELGLNSYEVGGQLKLQIPRFLVPFKLNRQSARYVPKTYASLGWRTIKRVKYYSLNVSQGSFGYNWRTSSETEFTLEPVSINYLNLTETSLEFDKFLNDYPQVAKSFEQQLILGSVYSYTYTASPHWRVINKFYYNGTLELSGNLVNAIYNITGLKDSGSDEPGKMLGVPYAQFIKLTNDVRYYITIHKQKEIAMRMLAGIGVPFNNSEVMPYIKQYFAGGSQDLRAFYSRTLGPGSYRPSDTLQENYFLDQSGEIKLMGNIEFRFPVTYRTNGALFMDAGNVWLLKKDATRPGGEFEFNKFYKDIAIGLGTGLRFDFTYLILRLDVAIPIRKPFLEADKRWIFNNPGFFKDYIFSLAVGYPF